MEQLNEKIDRTYKRSKILATKTF